MPTASRSSAQLSIRCSTSTSKTPFDTKVLGVTVTVERIDMTDHEQIIAICRRGRSLHAIPILDLPLPSRALRAWSGLRRTAAGWPADSEWFPLHWRQDDRVPVLRVCRDRSPAQRNGAETAPRDYESSYHHLNPARQHVRIGQLQGGPA